MDLGLIGPHTFLHRIDTSHTKIRPLLLKKFMLLIALALNA